MFGIGRCKRVSECYVANLQTCVVTINVSSDMRMPWFETNGGRADLWSRNSAARGSVRPSVNKRTFSLKSVGTQRGSRGRPEKKKMA